MMNLIEKCKKIVDFAICGNIDELLPQEYHLEDSDIPKRYRNVNMDTLYVDRIYMNDIYSLAQECNTIVNLEDLITTVVCNHITGYTLAPWSSPRCNILKDVTKYLDTAIINSMEKDEIYLISYRIYIKIFVTLLLNSGFYENNTKSNFSVFDYDINNITRDLDIISKHSNVISNIDEVMTNVIDLINLIEKIDSIYSIKGIACDYNDDTKIDNTLTLLFNTNGLICAVSIICGDDIKLYSTQRRIAYNQEIYDSDAEQIVETTAIELPDNSCVISSGPIDSVRNSLVEFNDRCNNCDKDTFNQISKAFDSIISSINSTRDGIISLGELNNIMKVEFDHQLEVVNSTFQKMMIDNPKFFKIIQNNIDAFKNILNKHKVELLTNISNYSNTDMILSGVPIENVASEEICQAKSNAISFLNDFAKTMYDSLIVGIVPSTNKGSKSKNNKERTIQPTKNSSNKSENTEVVIQKSYFPTINDESILKHIIIPNSISVQNVEQEKSFISSLKIMANICEQRDYMMNAPQPSVFLINSFSDVSNFVAERCIPDFIYNGYTEATNWADCAEFRVINGVITLNFKEIRPSNGGFLAGWGSIIAQNLPKSNITMSPINGTDESIISINIGSSGKMTLPCTDEITTNPAASFNDISSNNVRKLHLSKRENINTTKLTKKQQQELYRAAKKQRRIQTKNQKKKVLKQVING